MQIQCQEGLVSTINLTPCTKGEDYSILRDRLFAEVARSSHCTPLYRADDFDESIVVFDDEMRALQFLAEFIRATVDYANSKNSDICARSSLCRGNYFVNQEQIYGEAVNYATKLALSSRKNEVLVCTGSADVVKSFLSSHQGLRGHRRESKQPCFSIGLNERDNTFPSMRHYALNLEIDNKQHGFRSSRCEKISIGRAPDSDIIVNADHISRHHATVILQFDKIFIEDHSANGTYLYFDNREIFLTHESAKVGQSGAICCGHNLQSSRDEGSLIRYQLTHSEQSRSAQVHSEQTAA